LLEVEFLSSNLKILPLFLAVFAWEITSKFFQYKWLYNELINSFVVLHTLNLSRHFFEQYDKLLIEYNGPLFFQAIYTKAHYNFNNGKV
jgi:hypothetical protein